MNAQQMNAIISEVVPNNTDEGLEVRPKVNGGLQLCDYNTCITISPNISGRRLRRFVRDWLKAVSR